MRWFTKKQDIEEILAGLYDRLGREAKVVDLKTHEGWQLLSTGLLKTAEELRNEIVRLSSDPSENAAQIVYLRANIEAIYALVGIVDQSHRNWKLINKNINEKLDAIENDLKIGRPVRL